MKRRGKGNARNKGDKEQEINKGVKQNMLHKMKEWGYKKHILGPIPESWTTDVCPQSELHQHRTLTILTWEKETIQREYNKTINKMKKLSINSVYIADNFRVRKTILPKSLINKKADIEDTLIILQAFALQILILKKRITEKEEKKCEEDGYVKSANRQARLAQLEIVQKGVLKDTQTLRDQLKYFDKKDKRRRNVKENSVDPYLIVDSRGEDICNASDNSSETKIRRLYVPNKSQSEITLEYLRSFYWAKLQILEDVYSRKNTCAKAKEPTPERRNAQQHCEILSRLIQVMETDLVRMDLEDWNPTNASGLENIYGDAFDSAANAKKKVSLNPSNAVIIVNAKGENITKDVFSSYKFSPKQCL